MNYTPQVKDLLQKLKDIDNPAKLTEEKKVKKGARLDERVIGKITAIPTAGLLVRDPQMSALMAQARKFMTEADDDDEEVDESRDEDKDDEKVDEAKDDDEDDKLEEAKADDDDEKVDEAKDDDEDDKLEEAKDDDDEEVDESSANRVLRSARVLGEMVRAVAKDLNEFKVLPTASVRKNIVEGLDGLTAAATNLKQKIIETAPKKR